MQSFHFIGGLCPRNLLNCLRKSIEGADTDLMSQFYLRNIGHQLNCKNQRIALKSLRHLFGVTFRGGTFSEPKNVNAYTDFTPSMIEIQSKSTMSDMFLCIQSFLTLGPLTQNFTIVYALQWTANLPGIIFMPPTPPANPLVPHFLVLLQNTVGDMDERGLLPPTTKLP